MIPKGRDFLLNECEEATFIFLLDAIEICQAGDFHGTTTIWIDRMLELNSKFSDENSRPPGDLFGDEERNGFSIAGQLFLTILLPRVLFGFFSNQCL